MKRIGLGAASLLAVLASSGASASAAPVTIGTPLVGNFQQSASSGFSGTLLNLTIGEPGALPASPVDGAIVSWSFLRAVDGPFRLRVLRPAGANTYTSVGTSAEAYAKTEGLETFPTTLPIKAGDTIGLDIAKGRKIGALPNFASVFGVIVPPPVEGGTGTLAESATGVELAFNAVVQPAPAVTAVSPKQGSFKGGTKVKITGTDFSGATAVRFGGAPAKRFTVVSETQITAVAPKAGKPRQAAVTVTTIAGTTAPAAFKLTACKVPKLKTKTLQAAKKALKKAGCKLGKVKKTDGVTGKTGKVTEQGKPAGKKLAPGAKVNVTLG